MSTQLRRSSRLAAVLAAAAAAPALAQPTFTVLGTLPGTRPIPSSQAWGVSADGSTVVGDSIISGHPIFGATYAAFRWTAGDGMENIYNLGGIGTTCRAYGVNADGTVVVGMADYGVLSPTQIVAFIWRQGIGVVEIGDLPGGPSGSARAAARGVSSDASFVAGQGESGSGAEPFRYSTFDSEFVGLGDLPGGAFGGSGYGISADGGTVVGSSIMDIDSATEAFRWTPAEGMVSIGRLSLPAGYTPFAEAYGANANGTVIVGLSRSMASLNNGWEAFRWTQAGGMVGLGDLPGGAVLSEAYATTADGAIVVGKGGVLGTVTPFGTTTAPRAVIWDAQNGLRDLNVVLTGLGLNLGDMVLTEARGISASGRVMVGQGTHTVTNIYEAWRVDLGPPPCPVDYDHNGQIQPADVAIFVATWFSSLTGGNLNGDFDGNGAVEPADVAAFVTAWFSALVNGC